MSFIYAEKGVTKDIDRAIPFLHIMGDTKFTHVEGAPNIKNWGKKTYEILSRYGLVKSMIIAPKCCVSFAGNDIAYVHDLLTFIYTEKCFSEDQLLAKAFQLHTSAPKDAIEFLICTIDDVDEAHIYCIKGGKMERNCSQAWIGSPEAYNALQAQRDFSIPKSEYRFSLSQFQTAIENSGDITVGGYITDIRYSDNIGGFLYSERMESHIEQQQIVQLGEPINIYGDVAEGGYLVHYPESPSVFSLSIEQGDLSIIYTNGTKYDEENSFNEYTKYFMIPILMRSSTWKPIEAIITI